MYTLQFQKTLVFENTVFPISLQIVW